MSTSLGHNKINGRDYQIITEWLDDMCTHTCVFTSFQWGIVFSNGNVNFDRPIRVEASVSKSGLTFMIALTHSGTCDELGVVDNLNVIVSYSIYIIKHFVFFIADVIRQINKATFLFPPR